MKALLSYIQEVKMELTKVSWPKKEEVTRLTLLVFTTSAIISLYLGLLDYGFTKLLTYIVSR